MRLYNGDCLEVMKHIPDGSIDMICTDPPYGVTACHWDKVVDIPAMWQQFNRVISKNGAMVMTATQPFATDLINGNRKYFKYEWVWNKILPSGMITAKYQPMKTHENILIFAKTSTLYNPQMIKRINPIKAGGMSKGESFGSKKLNALKKVYYEKYPMTIITVIKTRTGQHPTQKPLELMEYLIKTYTNEGMTVLDPFAGSFTTGVACQNLGRKFLGIEKDPGYYKLGKQRMEDNRKLW